MKFHYSKRSFQCDRTVHHFPVKEYAKIELFSLPVTIQFHLKVVMMVGARKLVRKIGGNDGSRDTYV